MIEDYYENLIWSIGDKVQDKNGTIGNVQEIISETKVLVDYLLYNKEENVFDLMTAI